VFFEFSNSGFDATPLLLVAAIVVLSLVIGYRLGLRAGRSCAGRMARISSSVTQAIACPALAVPSEATAVDEVASAAEIAETSDASSSRSQDRDLTCAEIAALTDLAGRPADSDGDMTKRRYVYDCQQTVYAWNDDDAAAAIAPGVGVRCHDIAMQGVSFFWPDAPAFERLIISLGNPQNPLYMAADVVQSKAVYVRGEVLFIVGCRFTGRGPEFSEQSRVLLNVRRARTAATTHEALAQI
jgi:hypothetical protein